jgi:hypothetical protein
MNCELMVFSKQEVGIWRVKKRRFCCFLYTFNIHLYMHIFRRIFLSNYWWQESDMWEAFLDPSDSEKCAYMFNVYKNQLSRQTGSRNLMGPKMLPTIWGTYMTLVTKYQISVINRCWEKCGCFLYTFNIHLYMHIFRRIFLSNYWWQESDMWEAFLDPSDSYFLFADLVDFYTHWTYMRNGINVYFKQWHATMTKSILK